MDPIMAFDALLERQQRQIDAQFYLLTLDNFENVAGFCDELKGNERDVRLQRSYFATHYREAVGVPIEMRHKLRERLMDLAETGDDTVEQIIEEVLHHGRDDFSSSDRVSGQ